MSFQRHPDTQIIADLFASLNLGELVTYQQAAKALTMSPSDPVFRTRGRAAIKYLRIDRSINIGVIRKEGYVRETPEHTLARVRMSRRPSIRRRAKEVGELLSNTKPEELPEERRGEYFTERTVNNVIYQATATGTRKKLLAAVVQANATLPMARALEVLGGKIDQPEA